MDEKPKIPKMRVTGIAGRGKGVMKEIKNADFGRERGCSHKKSAAGRRSALRKERPFF